MHSAVSRHLHLEAYVIDPPGRKRLITGAVSLGNIFRGVYFLCNTSEYVFSLVVASIQVPFCGLESVEDG
jgi:hypothetical protein